MGLYAYKKYVRTKRTLALELGSQIALIAGLLFLFWALFPILSFQILHTVDTTYALKSPVQTGENTIKNPSVLGAFNIFSTNIKDFTDAAMWFPAATVHAAEIHNNLPSSYTLSIPRLNIYDAYVQVDGTDLNKGLIHYRPVVGPGEEGTIAIFGHSTLPQLYNVKDYKSIFTYLPSLTKGDEIYITSQGVEYKYIVQEMFVVKPEEISVLDQQKGASYLSLITCVPPGTWWNRLVVKAKLASL